jgi:hypothetical protein
MTARATFTQAQIASAIIAANCQHLMLERVAA